MSSTTKMPELMKDRDIAPMLDVTPRTIRDWAQQGRFPYPVIDEPRCKRWTREQVDHYMRTGKVR